MFLEEFQSGFRPTTAQAFVKITKFLASDLLIDRLKTIQVFKGRL